LVYAKFILMYFRRGFDWIVCIFCVSIQGLKLIITILCQKINVARTLGLSKDHCHNLNARLWSDCGFVIWIL